MRHAEKIPEDPVHLSPKGRVRADHLMTYVKHMVLEDIIHDRPNYLISMKQKSPKKSNRPKETLEPLAAVLGLKIHDKFQNKDIDEAIEQINNPDLEGKTVIVCWSHHQIPKIAKGLGLPVKGWNTYGDDEDDGDDFRTVWILTNTNLEDSSVQRWQSFKSFEVTDYDHSAIFDDDLYKSYVDKEWVDKSQSSWGCLSWMDWCK